MERDAESPSQFVFKAARDQNIEKAKRDLRFNIWNDSYLNITFYFILLNWYDAYRVVIDRKMLWLSYWFDGAIYIIFSG